MKQANIHRERLWKKRGTELASLGFVELVFGKRGERSVISRGEQRLWTWKRTVEQMLGERNCFQVQ